MSSLENGEPPTVGLKKRKLQRACDYCRRQKSDGFNMPNNRCSKCTMRRIECTYLMEHTPTYRRSYVKDLEGRVERMERLMNKYLPGKDIAKELENHQSDKELTDALTPALERSHGSRSRVDSALNPLGITVAPAKPGSVDNATDNDYDSDSDSEGGQELDKELAEDMQKLSMHPQPLRYHGKSSSLVFIRSAMSFKDEHAGAQPARKRGRQHLWVKAFMEDGYHPIEGSSFPPRDLMDSLVNLYFAQMNCYCPLLHEPTFRQSIEDEVHLRHGGFGATVLLVCAIGSRFTRDPRVLLDDSDHHQSAGWKWFALVERVQQMAFSPAKIYDLQICVLTALFLQGTTEPQSVWSVIGTGIRIALDVGAHRKKMYSPTPNVEEELWRRAFWILVFLEWVTSYGLGRPSSIYDEDLDLALPTECDDEYWLTHKGEPLFKQPPGKPSKVTAFVCMLKLGQILAFTTRTIYPIGQSHTQLGQPNEQWEQRVVADLDSALNQWSDTLPSHLRWDPEQRNVLWLTQAARLRAFHYYTQFAIHQPFIAASRCESPLSFPSIIICTNGARSTIQVLEALYERTGSPCHRNIGILFMSGVVLIRNMLGLKRSGRVVNSRKDLASVEKAVEMLWSLRYEIHVAETLGKLLGDLVSAFKKPLPPDTGVLEGARKRTIGTTERTEAPTTSRQLIHDPRNDAVSAPSSTSVVPAVPLPGATQLHVPPDLGFLLPDASSAALPVGADDLDRHPTQAFGVPTSGSAQWQRELRAPPPSLSAPLHTYGFLPRQGFAAQPRPCSNPEHTQFAMAGGNTAFGDLQPLGYGELVSFLPSTSASASISVSVSRVEMADYNYSRSHHGPVDATTMETEDHADTGMPDLSLSMDVDDALTQAWSNLPPAIMGPGWEEWGSYLADTNFNAET